jgi:large subunit ribosomal protein L10
MPTPQKAQVIEEIQNKFENSSGIYFTNYQGIDVGQMTKLRDKFRENNVEFKVTKNTLTAIGAKNAGFDGLEEILKGMVGIAYSSDDPTAPARVIKKFIEGKGNLDVLGILFEGQLYGSDKYLEFADLPTREELLAKLLAGLNYPMSKLAMTLGGAMTKLTRTLTSLKETKA